MRTLQFDDLEHSTPPPSDWITKKTVDRYKPVNTCNYHDQYLYFTGEDSTRTVLGVQSLTLYQIYHVLYVSSLKVWCIPTPVSIPHPFCNSSDLFVTSLTTSLFSVVRTPTPFSCWYLPPLFCGNWDLPVLNLPSGNQRESREQVSRRPVKVQGW